MRTSKSSRKLKRARIERVRARNRKIEQAVLNDEWNEACAKCVGSSHAAAQMPCQDAAFTHSFPSGLSVVALADGAGSARFSHYGSSFVVKRAAQLISDHYADSVGPRYVFDDFKERLIQQLQIELAEMARAGIDFTDAEREQCTLPSRAEQELVPCELKDLSCTFLAVATRGNRYFALHLGDGVIGAEVKRCGKTCMQTVSAPENGEFANETVFLTCADAAAKTRGYVGKLDSIGKKTTGFILMSDGPESVLFEKSTQSLAPACHKLILATRELDQEVMNQRLAATLQKVISRKTSDDCSIALMARHGKS